VRSAARPLWAWSLAAALLTTAALLGYLARWGTHYGLDFAVYRDASRWWLGGHDPYASSFTVHHLPFTYPPFALAALSWTTALPAVGGRWVLWIASIVASTGAVAIVANRQGRRWSPQLWLASLAWVSLAMLLLEPARSGMDYGQIEFLLLFLVVADLLLVPPRYRGLAIGVAAAIKLTPLVFVLLFLLGRDWKAVWRAASAFVGCALLTWIPMPSLSATYWLHEAFVASRTGSVSYPGNQSWYAVVHRAPFAAHAPTAAWLALCLATVGVSLFVAKRCIDTGRTVLALVAVALMGLLVSPISWSHHWIWLLVIPPALTGAGRRQVTRPVRSMLWALVALGVLAPYWWSSTGALGVLLADLLPVLTFVTLAIWCISEQRAARERAVEPLPGGSLISVS
jgi:alpha-1,2-mannosyltransferase